MNLKYNIIANLAGRFWSVFMNVAFIPIYIRFMGIESYGLIGVYMTLTALLFVLDAGQGVTLNRELARLSVLPGREQESRNLVRTLEVVYWIMAVVMALLFTLLSPYLATHWLQFSQLSSETMREALFLIGLAIACYWPFTLYSGGLLGLQKQVSFNLIVIIMATLRGVGSVLVLWLVSPSVLMFFLWQGIINILQTVTVGICLWRNLPKSLESAHFERALLHGLWKFTAGTSAISITFAILTQVDKILLSKLLPLKIFGYYTIANTVAASLNSLMAPLFNTFYPRFSQLVSQQNERQLVSLYHRSSQLMSVLLLPVAAMIALFSYPVLLLWTKDPEVADHAHGLLSLLVIGTALSGLFTVPHALQLAYGWTTLALAQNFISTIVLVPVLVIVIPQYGALGAATIWMILNISYVFIGVQIMHQRLLKSEKWAWYLKDVGLPLLAVLLSATIAYFLFLETMSKMTLVLWLGGAWFITMAVALMTVPKLLWRPVPSQ